MQSIIISLCTGFVSLTLSSSVLKYSNRWMVQIDGDNDEADRLAQKHGFANNGKVIDNYYSFQHQELEKVTSVPSAHLHEELLSEPNVNMVEQQIMKSYKLLSSESVNFHVNDKRWPDMWYMNRDDGQPTYNVIDVWKRNITGAGVVVAVVDEGLDPEHPEIKDNYDKRASLDVVDNDRYPLPKNTSVPQYGHGDKCAGVIAAVANNSICGVGLAYNANLGGIRLFVSDEAIDVDEARALIHETDHIDIFSNSWGPSDKGYEVAGPGHLTQRALRNGAERGRRGLGSIYVFAAGNGGLYVKDSCSFNGYVNNIYTIAITGIKSDGSIPIVGENCAGIMAVTYTMDIFKDTSKVVTADTNKACTNHFGASSASAAMASGLIALMLSANHGLSWRDVQHIIVRSARPGPVNIGESNWNTNKAGLRVNDYVGFGLMDATRMVDLAVNWTEVPSKVNCTIPRKSVNSFIPSQESLEETINLSNWSDLCDDKINFLEHVEVSVHLTYTLRGELLIKLVSPQGTVSNLTHYRMSDASFGAKDLTWVLMTLHHWGENAIGPWKLTLENSHPDHDNTGFLFDWMLTLHGTTDNPLAYNLHAPTPVSRMPMKKLASTKESKKSPCQDSLFQDADCNLKVILVTVGVVIIVLMIACVGLPLLVLLLHIKVILVTVGVVIIVLIIACVGLPLLVLLLLHRVIKRQTTHTTVQPLPRQGNQSGAEESAYSQVNGGYADSGPPSANGTGAAEQQLREGANGTDAPVQQQQQQQQKKPKPGEMLYPDLSDFKLRDASHLSRSSASDQKIPC